MAEQDRERAAFNEEDHHLNADGEVCDCGETPPQPGLVHYRRSVGIQAAPVLYTPPKYGPPPGYPAEKWRNLSRSARRAALRETARQINRAVRSGC